jgi:hypothetical protein
MTERRLIEDGAAVEVEKEDSRLVESNGACIDLGMNAAVNVVHGLIDITGMEDILPVLPMAHGISQAHWISLSKYNELMVTLSIPEPLRLENKTAFWGLDNMDHAAIQRLKMLEAWGGSCEEPSHKLHQGSLDKTSWLR